MDALSWLMPQVQSAGDFAFFALILEFIREEINAFGFDLLKRVGAIVSFAAFSLVTIWIVIQGYRIVTGQSRDSMSALMVSALRITLIVSLASTLAVTGSDMHELATKDLSRFITNAVTGKNEDVEKQIDHSLRAMQVGFTSIQAIDVLDDPGLDREKSQAIWMVGLGAGGPPLVAATMLLLYQIALALFIGLGPLFIMCLIFDQTKPLFSRWLYYGLGTMFSMAVLSVMVAIGLKMVIAVAEAFWMTAAAGALAGTAMTEGVSTQALQQGGLGIILSTLIVSAPPMAAMFFQGTMGHFNATSVFGGGGTRDSMGRTAGQPGYMYPTPASNHRDLDSRIVSNDSQQMRQERAPADYGLLVRQSTGPANTHDQIRRPAQDVP